MNLLDSVIRLVVSLGIDVWVWERYEDEFLRRANALACESEEE